MTQAAPAPGSPGETERTPRVSAVVVTYNSGPFVERCLAALDVAERGGWELEAVAVDNCSTDDTWQRLQRPYAWLRTIANDRNAGFAAATNMGIRATKGEYVLLLNPDTEVSPGAIGTLVRFLESHPQAGVVGPRLVLSDGRLDPACHRGFHTPWASLTYMLGLERLFPRARAFNGYHLGHLPMDRAHEIDSPSGACMLVRRAVLDRVGLLDEAFFMYAEDEDLCLRAKAAGYRVYYEPAATVLHVKGTSSGIKRHSERVSAATMETRLRSLEAFHDSMLTFYDKHYAARYPRPVRWLVAAAVGARRRVARWQLRRRLGTSLEAAREPTAARR